MRVLVTGCLGFIGSYFVKYLMEREPSVKVIGFDNSNDFKTRHRLDGVWDNERFNMMFGSLLGDVSELLEGVDVIVNFAAKTFVDHSVKNPSSHFNNNIAGTFALLEQARTWSPSLFVQISTDEVYGETSDVYFTEEATLNPTNPYAACKASADMLCLAYAKMFKIPMLITRCENNYGPWQHWQKALPVFVKKSLNGELIPLYSPGTQKRCWLHVQDHCSAIWHLIKGGKKGIYNIGAHQEMQNVDLAKFVLNHLGKAVENIIMIDTRDIRPYHDIGYRIDTKKLESTGWKPEFDLMTGLGQTVDWFKNNYKWFD